MARLSRVMTAGAVSSYQFSMEDWDEAIFTWPNPSAIATVTVDHSLDGGTTWSEIDTVVTAVGVPARLVAFSPVDPLCRFNFSAGNGGGNSTICLRKRSRKCSASEVYVFGALAQCEPISIADWNGAIFHYTASASGGVQFESSGDGVTWEVRTAGGVAGTPTRTRIPAGTSSAYAPFVRYRVISGTVSNMRCQLRGGGLQ
jgi:hypothetical protein